MHIPRTFLLTLVAAIICFGSIHAEKAETFQQAKELSLQLNKPIMFEFVHED